MINWFFRILWRLFVFGIGIAITYLTVTKGWHYLHQQLPAAIVIIIIYLLAAYIAIPFLIRLWRIVIKPNHIPIYTTSPDGWPVDPVNIAIVARSRKHLIKRFNRAGWTLTDRSSIKNLLKAAYAMILNKSYPAAPMSKLILFNRAQDIAFQAPDERFNTGSPRHRHHVRLWRLEIPEEPDNHHDFWHDLLKLFKRRRAEIWVGAATHDISFIAFRRRNLQITHRIDSDTNKERDYLIKSFKNTGSLVGKVEDIASGHELKFNGQTFGVNIIVDGRLKVVRLK
jgi:hypothetical protein